MRLGLSDQLLLDAGLAQRTYLRLTPGDSGPSLRQLLHGAREQPRQLLTAGIEGTHAVLQMNIERIAFIFLPVRRAAIQYGRAYRLQQFVLIVGSKQHVVSSLRDGLNQRLLRTRPMGGNDEQGGNPGRAGPLQHLRLFPLPAVRIGRVLQHGAALGRTRLLIATNQQRGPADS